VARFDTETKATFLDLYTKVDAEAYGADEEVEEDLEATDLKQSEDYSDPDEDEEVF
jgi:hypothetical protein